MLFHDSELVTGIYDTIADVSLWPDVLDRIANRAGARGAMLFEIEDKAALNAKYLSTAYSRDVVDGYMREFMTEEMADQHAFVRHIRQHDRVDIVPDTIIYDDVQEFYGRSHVKATMAIGLLHRAGALLNKDNIEVGRFSIQYGADRGAMTADETSILNQLLPHVAKAFHLGSPVQQLAAQNQGLIAAIDRLTIGICILDRTGNVVVANQEFNRQAQDYPVFQITPSGALHFPLPRNQASFSALRSNAMGHGRFGARPRKEAIPVDDDSFLCIEVAPIDHIGEIGSQAIGGCLVYSTDTSRPMHCDTPLIRQAFGLTETESGLVDDICQGHTNVQIAARRERTVDTINSQVKSILNKSGSANRTQLVRLMMSFGTPLLQDAA